MTDNAAPQERPVLQTDEDMAARYLEITGRADEQADETPADAAQEPAETQGVPAETQEAEETDQADQEGAEEDGESDQEDAETEPEGEGEEPELFIIDQGDAKEEVTLDQLVDGFLKAKTGETEVSEALTQEREALAAGFAQVDQVREGYMSAAAQLGAFMEAMAPPVPDPALVREDPLEFQAQDVARREWESKYNALRADFEAAEREKQQRQSAALVEAHSAALKELPKFVPEWKDETVLLDALKETTAYLEGQGFTNDELVQVTDPRSSVIAWKAMQWDKLQEQKPIATKKAREAPKAVRKGERRAKRSADKKVQEAKQVLRKTGSDEAAEAFLLAKWNQGAR